MRPLAPGAALIFGLAACMADERMPGPQEGAMLFADNCTACHDYQGSGGELAGGGQAPDLTQIAARNGGVFPQAEVLTQIDGYGQGRAGEAMPEFGKLLEGPLVPVDIDGALTPTPRPLAALLVYLESIQTP
jgi:mono/diheme cytochrome c family protein